MSGGWYGELDHTEESRLLECAKESKLFLHDLIGVGETLLVDAENSTSPIPLSWADICGMKAQPPSARRVTLGKSNGLKLNLPATQMLAADSGELDVTSDLSFGATANVCKDGDHIVLKVTSDNASLDGQLVGYCLSDAAEDRLGFVLLRAGVLGTVSGMTRLALAEISGEQTLNCTSIDSSDLCNADLPLLKRAIAGDLDDDRSVEAWRRWIESTNAGDDGPGLADLLRQLRRQLQE